MGAGGGVRACIGSATGEAVDGTMERQRRRKFYVPVEATSTSATRVPADAPRGSVPVGTLLRLTRERLGWTLEDVETSLKIRFETVQAIEEGRFDVLPTGSYSVGFVRAYARFLGLDHDAVVQQFRAEAGVTGEPASLSFPLPMYEGRLPRNVLILASLVVAAGGYAAWFYSTASERTPIPRVAAIPEQLAALANRPEPSAARAEAATASTREPVGPADIQPLSLAQGPQASSPATVTTLSTPVVAQTAPLDQPQAAALPTPTVSSPGTPSPTAAERAAEPRIVLRANREVRVDVRDQHATVIFSKTMRVGDTFGVPNRPGLVLTSSRAGGLDVNVDGRPAPTFTQRVVDLDPDRLKAGGTAEPAPPPGATPPRPNGPSRPRF